ncbi:hypothetical protein Pelo_1385 [Pelomyxa schiedti]|nr:hypothetical protein Pelo_1385 [Pelomyxa schiedti]
MIANTPMRAGQIWFLISCRWLDSWKRYVSYYSDHSEVFPKPGPIHNSELLEQDGELVQFVYELIDYELVSGAAISYQDWHGNILTVEVMPMKLHVVKSSDTTVLVPAHFSKMDTVGHLKATMCKIMGLDPANIRVGLPWFLPAQSIKPLAIEEATYARDQFISLGVGVIVGRCGRSSPASALTPPSLSLLGQNWVVLPCRRAYISAAASAAPNGGQMYEVLFSLSPTLGLVGHPTIVEVVFAGGGTPRKVGFVGPESLGDRFALVIKNAGSVTWWSVMDTHNKGVRPLVYTTTLGVLCNNRRWATACEEGEGRGTMSLWNFDEVESGKVGEIKLPGEVHSVAFQSDDSLVATQSGGGVITIDLGATFAQKRLVLECPPRGHLASLGPEESGNTLMCWKGMTYALTGGRNPAVVCLDNGQRTPLPQGRGWPIGGPYFKVTNRNTLDRDVFSVVEPTKLCCRHKCGRLTTLHFGHEMVVRETAHILVTDAVSGFVVFKFQADFDVLGVAGF